METLSFIKQYIISPRFVGALLPSSKSLAARMIEDINFKNAGCIVEYGPGTGAFTQKLLDSRNADTVLLVIEYNYDFYNMLKSKYDNEKNFFLIHGSAENVDKYLKNYGFDYADYIVSGLPFGCLPKDISDTILEKTKEILRKDGKFITFQYTLLKKSLISSYFHSMDIKREYRNFPPAYVFCCCKQ